jgi:hypothetical protein
MPSCGNGPGSVAQPDAIATYVVSARQMRFIDGAAGQR